MCLNGFMDDVNVYNTKDFYTAVLLRVMDFPLETLHRETGGFVVFTFLDPNHNAEAIIQDYWDRKLSVPDARAFVEAISELKTRLYEVSR
ncbi:MAG: hypothetical protein ACD_22C00166G0004 [uncultured bacterium]|nr:MAG: hypothetical protein ACD_22C00166G0004 [uncultured bacterium]